MKCGINEADMSDLLLIDKNLSLTGELSSTLKTQHDNEPTRDFSNIKNCAQPSVMILRRKHLSLPFQVNITGFILLHQKFLQFDWLRAVVFQLNLKYLHVKITTFCG